MAVNVSTSAAGMLHGTSTGSDKTDSGANMLALLKRIRLLNAAMSPNNR